MSLLATAWVLALTPEAGAQALSLSAGVPKRSPVALDPWLPTGAELAARIEPPATRARGCSFRAPICVHPGAGITAEAAQRALGALELAWSRLVWAMRLPEPLPEHGGGGPELDLYLDASGDRSELLVEHGPIDTARFDRAPAFCVLRAAQGSLIERDATLCVGEAVAWRLDASSTPHTKRAYASHLWLSAAQPTSLDVQAVDDVQAHPERAVVTRERTDTSEGAAIFFDHLDWSLGRSHSGTLASALLSAAADKTAPGLWQWDNEPDVMDVLRHTAGKDPRSMAQLIGDFAVSRAFFGDRDDGSHMPTLGFSGAFGRVRFDWVLPFSSLPRRVASAHPIEPTGSIYIWVPLDKVPAKASLALQAVWEAPVAFRWTLVRVAADGREISRLNAAFQERGTEVEQRLVNLEDAAGILIVGTNLGGVDLKHPFDPDVAPFEPHACTVYLAQL